MLLSNDIVGKFVVTAAADPFNVAFILFAIVPIENFLSLTLIVIHFACFLSLLAWLSLLAYYYCVGNKRICIVISVFGSS